MVKNLRGGNKAKKRKNSSGDNSHRALKIRNKNSSSTDAQLYGKSFKYTELRWFSTYFFFNFFL